MDASRRRILLQAARNAIASHLGAEAPRVDPAEAGPVLGTPAAAFVSLHRHGELRGCIGTFAADLPLAKTVRDMAIAAATRDPRFLAMTADELEGLEIEISVLSAPRRARADEVVVGKHGLLLSRSHHRGVLLPQVAVEHGWTPQEFLAHTCRKAGLPEEAWRDPATTIEVFEAEIFS